MLSEAGGAVFIFRIQRYKLYKENKQGFDGKIPNLTHFITFEEYIMADSR